MDKILGLEKLSLVDYEGKVSCSIFTGGCNFRCPFCHNSLLVLDYDELEEFDIEEICKYLKKRVGVIDAVCISGGEPTLYNNLEDLIDRIRNLNYLIKLDTNGTNPQLLEKLINEKKIDYVAMDVKNCFDKYFLTSGINNQHLLNKVKESIELLKKDVVDYEFRTTLVKEFHSTEDIIKMSKELIGAKGMYLQKFVDHNSCIQDNLHAINEDEANSFKDILSKCIKEVHLRGY